MRRYQPIWEQIKTEHTASLVVDPKLHARIIKAVIKEKDKDTGWKLLTSEIGKKYKLQIEATGKLIIFTLEDISPISINDL